MTVLGSVERSASPQTGFAPTPITDSTPITDWTALWRELVRRAENAAPERVQGDYWAGRAEEFHERVSGRWRRQDTIYDFVLQAIEPGRTVLDIGAGTGAWALPLSVRASRITAIDSSASMIAVLRRNLELEAITNVDIVTGSWPDVTVASHDYSMASQSAYGAADLPAFITRMMELTRRTCFLVLNMPVSGGILSEATTHLWGHPMDRPNFTVAYNVLLEMGLAPNVLVGQLRPGHASSATVADALAQVKRHFALTSSTEHDAYLTDLLERRLDPRDGRLLWPTESRPTLAYWSLE